MMSSTSQEEGIPGRGEGSLVWKGKKKKKVKVPRSLILFFMSKAGSAFMEEVIWFSNWDL